ncbi:hypothetical protein V8G54_023957 [Vigna mungo]|uniref:Protein kinase domain-containing protein n=1 Tax=Vigna mungo TaxID=3915 RepID=A0AAQ3RT14_VIGMU
MSSPNLKSFTFNELKNATINFWLDSFLGEGGFGCVYKGWIDEHMFTASKPGSGMVGGPQRLSWSMRMNVAIGAATGLCFLHNAKLQVIYRDFKASNILLMR